MEFKYYKLLLNISIFTRIEKLVVSARVIIAEMKHHDKKRLEKKTAYLPNISQVTVL